MAPPMDRVHRAPSTLLLLFSALFSRFSASPRQIHSLFASGITRLESDRAFVHNSQMPITLAQVAEARANIAGIALRTPLVRCFADSPAEVWLKLENLQPIGSFKIRGAANVMARTPRHLLERGVLTASAGNMAQGVAFCARRIGVPATIVAPDTAPATKLRAVERLGGRVI